MSWLTSSIDRLVSLWRTALGELPGPPEGLQGELGPFSGDRVGAYEIVDSIGAGAMGHVYRARRVDDGVPVAVKILFTLAADDLPRRRFLREVDALRRLSSEHVVQVHDWGLTTDGYPFLAMDLLEGRSLQAILKERGRLPLGEIVELVEHSGAGLADAHARGIIHRDIKPSNLFLAQEPAGASWKVVDFGLSRIYGVQTSITQVGGVVGTPCFMSPEQAIGEPLDGRSDLFALAAVAYYALTGILPFGAAEPAVAMMRVLDTQPVAPSHVTTVPEDVDLVFALGMAKHVGDRLPNARVLASSLAAAAREELAADLRSSAQRLLQERPWRNLEEAPLSSAGDAPTEGWIDSSSRGS